MDLISKLKSAQVVKFGDFILKSGQKSSVYFDFRRIISYPRLFGDISYRLAMMIKCKDVVKQEFLWVPFLTHVLLLIY